MIVPQTFSSTTVTVVGDDTSIREAVARLLSLDPHIFIRSTANSIAEVGSRADVLVDESLLHDVKDLSIGEFITLVKSMPVPKAAPKRRLAAVPGNARDMRNLLSDREFQVVRLVAEGLSNKEISRRLALSDKTVKNHISHILAKLNLSARTQVAVHALRAGIV